MKPWNLLICINSYEIQHLKLPKPIIDVTTRWSSSFNMLKRLLELRDFIAGNVQTEHLSVHDWGAITSIVSVLAPVHTLTLKLQNCQLLLGDFYKFWLELSFLLKNINSDNSRKVLTLIESRQIGLLENETMYAALYLDPRFTRLLNTEKKNSRKETLKRYCFSNSACAKGN